MILYSNKIQAHLKVPRYKLLWKETMRRTDLNFGQANLCLLKRVTYDKYFCKNIIFRIFWIILKSIKTPLICLICVPTYGGKGWVPWSFGQCEPSWGHIYVSCDTRARATCYPFWVKMGMEYQWILNLISEET